MNISEFFQQDFIHIEFGYQFSQDAFYLGVSEGLFKPDDDLTAITGLKCLELLTGDPNAGLLHILIQVPACIKASKDIELGGHVLNHSFLWMVYGCISGAFDEHPIYQIPENVDYQEYIKTL